MKRLFFAALAVLLACNAFAVPAYPEMIQFTQPGNREITVSIFLRGDEKVHWAESVDGYSLLHGDDGSMMYAMLNEKGDMVASQYMATEIQNRSSEVAAFLKNTPKQLRFSKGQIDDLLKIWEQVEKASVGPKGISDLTGEKKFLVILFAFSDKHFSHTKNEFKNLFNQVNYTAEGRTGSVRDYYHDVSGGLFTLTVDVVGPFTGVYNTAFYGGTDEGAQYFAREAVDSAAAYVDFSDYDNDGDGYIDGLHIIFAGYGEEAGASSDCIWSHKWNIFDAPTYNNTVVNVYSCSPECRGNYGGYITNIGVICHELGHVFGAPDYYDTDYAGSGGEFPGLGKWDIMSSGSWNGNGKTPAQHNPYTKIFIYRWASCDTINAIDSMYILDPAETSNNAFHRVNTATPGDFYLLENRQNIKWDNDIPSHGMIVYHVHRNANGAHVTNHTHPQQIYILSKSTGNDSIPNATPASYGLLNSAYSTYPSTLTNHDSLTNHTAPWFKDWDGHNNSVALYNISESPTTGKIFFTVGNAMPTPISAQAEGIDNQSILVGWTSYGSKKSLVLMNSEENLFGTPDSIYNMGDTIDGGGIVIFSGIGEKKIVSGLERNKRYYFKVFTIINDSTYTDGIETSGTTLDCDSEDWTTENFEDCTMGGLPLCWTGEWAVDSVLGAKALSCQTTGSSSLSVITRPVKMDTVRDAVLGFRLHLSTENNATAEFKVEYRDTPSGEWSIVDNIVWQFGMATWQNIKIHISNFGDNSRFRFTLLSDGNANAAIDDIRIMKGSLIQATSDNNGTISPYGDSVLYDNESIYYVVSPLPGYKLYMLSLDGVKIPKNYMDTIATEVYGYSISGLSGKHHLYAQFTRKTDIQDSEKHNVQIFPNPTKNAINVMTEAGTIVELYNTNGQLLARKKSIDGHSRIDMRDLPKGIYILRCDSVTRKIVKQ